MFAFFMSKEVTRLSFLLERESGPCVSSQARPKTNQDLWWHNHDERIARSFLHRASDKERICHNDIVNTVRIGFGDSLRAERAALKIA